MRRPAPRAGLLALTTVLFAAKATAPGPAEAARRAPQAQGSAPAPNRDLRATVVDLLSGYEPGDPAPALRRLGAPATDVLLSLAQDPATPPLRRLRAIEALGYAPTPPALAYLRKLIAARKSATDSMGIFELAAALRALGGFGPQITGDLLVFLDHQSADVREGVVASLGVLHTDEALRALRARTTVERDSGVRARLTDVLRRNPSVPETNR